LLVAINHHSTSLSGYTVDRGAMKICHDTLDQGVLGRRMISWLTVVTGAMTIKDIATVARA
jgi:hypothetical protein